MLKGTLDDFTLPEIFRLLSFAKKTGRLDVARGAGDGKVYFRDGEVYYAESSLSRVPLGQKLIRAGALTEGGLNKALDQNAQTGQRVGQILMAQQTISQEQLEAAVRAQIEDSAFDLLRWELGDFSWEQEAEIAAEVAIAVSVENLIMEASRRLDELEVIMRKIPSARAVVAMAPAPPEGAMEININPNEWRMLVLVNGSRSVADIGELVGIDEFAAMRTLYGLVSAGLIEVASDGEDGVSDLDAGRESSPAIGEQENEGEAPPRENLAAGPAEGPVPGASEMPEPEHELFAIEAVALLEEIQPPGDEPAPDNELLVDPETAEPELDDHLADDPAVAEPAPNDQVAAETALEDDARGENALAESVEVASEPAPPPEWFEDPEAPAEILDQPGSEDPLTPPPSDVDNFLSDLMDDRPAAEAPEAPVASGAGSDPEAPEPATAGPPPNPGAEPSVDRAAAVRELAGLFGDEERSRPRAVPSAPDSSPQAAGAEGDQKKRVEDDDQVTKGLISRLIHGVKGL